MLEVQDLDGLILLKTVLRGTGGRDTAGTLALDTGAGFLALDADLGERLGIVDSASDSARIELADRALPRLRLGGLQIDQVSPVLTIDAGVVRRVTDRPVLGLLGQRPLAARALWLDYSLEKLALIPITANPPVAADTTGGPDRASVGARLQGSRAALAGIIAPAAMALPFELAGDGKILLAVRLSNPAPPAYSRALTLILDTGATKSVLFEDAIEDLVPGATSWPAIRGLSAPTLVGTSDARLAMVPSIELETSRTPLRCSRVDFAVIRSELSGALSQVAGTTIHGLLGASLLRRYRVTIDYPHRILWLEPPASHRGERPWEYSHVGIQIERWEGALRVVSVAIASPAARAGIHTGDELVAINGRDVERRDLTLVARELEGPPGTKISLTMRRGDAKKTYPLVRRQLL